VKIESMGRVVINLGVAGLLSALVGCATPQASGGPKGTTRPSTMPLDVTFVTDPGVPPITRIVVSPYDGDVSIEAVPEGPGLDRNWVTWTSASHSFSIKFAPIGEPCIKGRKKFGDENDCWNDSKKVGDKQVYKLKLNPGRGTKDKEILVAKYSVKSPAGCDEKNPGPNCLVLDPVIIVRY